MAKVGKVSNGAQVAQVCKGEMAERRSEETIPAKSLSYIDQNHSLLIVQVIQQVSYMTNKGICAARRMVAKEYGRVAKLCCSTRRCRVKVTPE